MIATQNTSPKAIQFTEELNALLAKYQYKLNPKIQYTDTGITPVFSLDDDIPAKTTIDTPLSTKNFNIQVGGNKNKQRNNR